jgi:hypothetical protein
MGQERGIERGKKWTGLPADKKRKGGIYTISSTMIMTQANENIQ